MTPIEHNKVHPVRISDKGHVKSQQHRHIIDAAKLAHMAYSRFKNDRGVPSHGTAGDTPVSISFIPAHIQANA